MHEIFEISLLDDFQDDELDIKAELSTSDSEMDAHSSLQPPNEAIPDKSYSRYVYVYKAFIKWQKSKNVNSFAESVLLEYFREMSTKYAPTSLWSMFSMLKSTITSKQHINISGYTRLTAFLKKKSEGYQGKKAKVFTAQDVNKFLIEAPDDEYLAMKTVLVFGVIGVNKVEKITNVKADYVKDNGNEIIVSIPDPKTRETKVYVIDGRYAETVRKYMKLRPLRASSERFFMQYRNGKCTIQVIGKHKIAQMPKEIAKFLQLPEFEAYTGHSFRRTSTTISADTGFETRLGHWKSSIVSDENVQESLGLKRRIGTFAADKINSPSTSSESSSFEHDDISENSSLSENEAPRRKRKKRPKRQKEIDWYDEECLAQIKLTTDMFKRYSNMGEGDKMNMLSEYSKLRVELFKKCFSAMNTVAINPTNIPMTDASMNTAQNGVVENGESSHSDFRTTSLVNTNTSSS